MFQINYAFSRKLNLSHKKILAKNNEIPSNKHINSIFDYANLWNSDECKTYEIICKILIAITRTWCDTPWKKPTNENGGDIIQQSAVHFTLLVEFVLREG